MSAEVPAWQTGNELEILLQHDHNTVSPASPKNAFDTTWLALNCGLWTPSAMHQSTCMTPMQGCWHFNDSSIKGQKTLSFQKPYGQTKDICPYHACVCWNTKHSDQPLAWVQCSKIIMKTISKILHLNSGMIPKFLASLLNQCISKGSKTNGLGRASRLV